MRLVLFRLFSAPKSCKAFQVTRFNCGTSWATANDRLDVFESIFLLIIALWGFFLESVDSSSLEHVRVDCLSLEQPRNQRAVNFWGREETESAASVPDGINHFADNLAVSLGRHFLFPENFFLQPNNNNSDNKKKKAERSDVYRLGSEPDDYEGSAFFVRLRRIVDDPRSQFAFAPPSLRRRFTSPPLLETKQFFLTSPPTSWYIIVTRCTDWLGLLRLLRPERETHS